MTVTRAHSFLVHPAKGEADPPEIGGTTVPKSGKLAGMLEDVFERAPSECKIEIVFRPEDDGSQRNACRDDLLSYLNGPTLSKGRSLATSLQDVTTNRSGLGLMFLIAGIVQGRHRLVVSRFPADEGIIAEENRRQLSVEFIERVFMKSAKAYKSVIYQCGSLQGGFWDGFAIDKQISGEGKELSDYWIRDFLKSELRTTGPAGTKRIAVALREAIRSAPDVQTRQELVAASMLLRNRDGQAKSGRQLVNELGLTGEASDALEHALPRGDLLEDTFTFDREEFEKQLAYRSVELDNGAILMSENSTFAEVFTQEEVDSHQRRPRIKFSTEGRVVDELLRRTRR